MRTAANNFSLYYKAIVFWLSRKLWMQTVYKQSRNSWRRTAPHVAPLFNSGTCFRDKPACAVRAQLFNLHPAQWRRHECWLTWAHVTFGRRDGPESGLVSHTAMTQPADVWDISHISRGESIHAKHLQIAPLQGQRREESPAMCLRSKHFESCTWSTQCTFT